MPKPRDLIDAAGEVREIQAEDLEQFGPATQVLPAQLLRKIGFRGPQKAPTKERITIRLSPEVVHTFRATGAGWQSRLDGALIDWLKTHKPV